MITIKIESGKCYITDQNVNSGFLLNSNEMESITLAELSLWANKMLDKKIEECSKCL